MGPTSAKQQLVTLMRSNPLFFSILTSVLTLVEDLLFFLASTHYLALKYGPDLSEAAAIDVPRSSVGQLTSNFSKGVTFVEDSRCFHSPEHKKHTKKKLEYVQCKFNVFL